MTDIKPANDSPIVGETQDTFKVKLIHQFPESLPAVYANNLVIQHTPEEFLISFYQAFPPPNLDGGELRATIEKMGGLPATCVARIAIPKDRMPDVVAAFVENLHQFQMKQRSSASSEDSSAKKASSDK